MQDERDTQTVLSASHSSTGAPGENVLAEKLLKYCISKTAVQSKHVMLGAVLCEGEETPRCDMVCLIWQTPT